MKETSLPFTGPDQMLTVPEAVRDLQAGRMIILCDDESRENEADICIAAQFATAEKINFIVHQACGLLCVALSGERLDALRLPLAESGGHPLQGTAFTTSVDAIYGTSTGISAHDRAVTVRTLVNPKTRPEDLARPGHVFPLRARAGGTLERRGHTEASVDLMRIAGLEPGSVICEILDENGEAARGQALVDLARKWKIGMLSVEAIAQYRRTHGVSLVSETSLPTYDTTFRLLHYRDVETNLDYMALLLSDVPNQSPMLVRIHSACATGDIFGSQRCDCQSQLHVAMKAIVAEGCGLLLYLPQEGRGIGLSGKLQAYRLQERGFDTVEANEALGYPVDARTYDCAAEILRDLGVRSVRLMTNSPTKIQALRECGFAVERVPLEGRSTENNLYYLQTKQRRLGHLLTCGTSHGSVQGTIPTIDMSLTVQES
jgi:3,4-dihydroxy 2-butanone 4-phosphate synthase/GTP cyclohydrolase II